MPPRKPPKKLVLRTAADLAYEELRDRIIHGHLAPSAPLRLSELAEQLGVSTMPVRAALLRLEGEGLVVQIPHRGASVAPLELEDLQEIQAVRAGIEGFAARLGAECIETADRARMSSLLERLDAFPVNGPLDTYLAIQWELHEICYAAAGRQRLLELIHDYRRRAERYIRLAVGSPAGFRDSTSYQHRLLWACERRNGEEAEDVIREALAWTVETLAPLLADRPGAADRGRESA